MSERNIFEGIEETVEFEIENADALKELFNKTKEENLKIQKRFADGTYTEDDLLNHLPRFGLGTKDKIEMYVVESKYFEDLVNRYTNIKEIEKLHQEENGLLRQELDMQIEHNKELEATLKQTQDSWFEDTQKLEQEKERNELFVASGNNINLERHIKNNYISKDKIKELQGWLFVQLGSYVRNEASPEQERIAGGINIINKILEV